MLWLWPAQRNKNGCHFKNIEWKIVQWVPLTLKESGGFLFINYSSEQQTFFVSNWKLCRIVDVKESSCHQEWLAFSPRNSRYQWRWFILGFTTAFCSLSTTIEPTKEQILPSKWWYLLKCPHFKLMASHQLKLRPSNFATCTLYGHVGCGDC